MCEMYLSIKQNWCFHLLAWAGVYRFLILNYDTGGQHAKLIFNLRMCSEALNKGIENICVLAVSSEVCEYKVSHLL